MSSRRIVSPRVILLLGITLSLWLVSESVGTAWAAASGERVGPAQHVAGASLTNGVDNPTLVLKPTSHVLGGEIVDAWGNRWTDGASPIYECTRDLAEIQRAYCTKLGTVHVSNGHWQMSFHA